jgi:hypothetical protein
MNKKEEENNMKVFQHTTQNIEWIYQLTLAIHAESFLFSCLFHYESI